LVRNVFWLIVVLVRFWGQRVKGQGHSRLSRQPVEFQLVQIQNGVNTNE